MRFAPSGNTCTESAPASIAASIRPRACAASPASATRAHEVVRQQLGPPPPPPGTRRRRTRARTSSTSEAGHTRELADRRRRLREPGGDRARRRHRRVLVVVDRAVGEHRDVRASPARPSRRRDRRARAPTRAPRGTAPRAGSRRRRSRPPARASAGRSRRCRSGCPGAPGTADARRAARTPDPRRRHVRRPTRARGSPRSMRGGRRAGWVSCPSASSGRSPAPIPRIIRPPEISSTVAAAAAVIAGCRVSGFVTAVPSSSRDDVFAASVRYA